MLFKIIKFLYLPLLLSISFFACNNNTEKTDKNKQLKGILNDSINQLDSLAEVLRLRNDSQSIHYARRAITLAKTYGNDDELIRSYNAIANTYRNNNKDSSFLYYNLAIKVANSITYSKYKPVSYYGIANIYLEVSNYPAAINSLDTCIHLSGAGSNYQVLSDAYNLMGLVYFTISDSMMARKMFKLAMRIGEKNQLSKQIGVALGNLALFEKDNNNAIEIQKRALAYLLKDSSAVEEISTLLVDVGLRQYNPDSACRYFILSLERAKHAHLHLIIIGALNNLAYSYLEKGNYPDAENCVLTLAIPIAKELNSLDWLGTLFDTYADILMKKGEPNLAFAALRKSIDYRNQYLSVKKEGQTKLLLAMLDVKSKEESLNEKESELKIRNSQNKFLILSLVAAFLIILIIVFSFITFKQKTLLKIKRQQIDSAQKLIEMEEHEKGRIGFELHDNIGYLVRMLDGFIKSMKFEDEAVKQGIIDKLKELGARIKNISNRVRLIKEGKNNLSELIPDIINDMVNLTGINADYFIAENIPLINPQTVLHLCRITQELITNANKYAHDAKIRIDITFIESSLYFCYRDNGPGYDVNAVNKKCIGLNSIRERIRLIGGRSILNALPGEGTKWEITIPLKNLQ